MSWRPAGRGTSHRINRFLKSDEWKHVALSEKIRLAGTKPRFGQIADGRLWLSEKGLHVEGLLFISRYGVVLPAHDPQDSSAENAEFLRRLLMSRRDRLFSMIGTDNRVQDLEHRIGEHPPDNETYRMLTGDREFADPGEMPADVTFHHASSADSERLWPLEKAYQYEEVLRKGSTLNERSGKFHFNETLKKQMVIYATLKGRPVAKAGTNARGWDWNQIGGVYVIPELRGSGFGHAVMVKLLAAIRKNGKKPCLFVKTSNQAALGLYERLDFSDRGAFRISYWSP